jgi:hypothetical protein
LPKEIKLRIIRVSGGKMDFIKSKLEKIEKERKP